MSVADTDGLDSASQRNVAAEQKKLMMALFKHVHRLYGADAYDRFANILLRIPTIRVQFFSSFRKIDFFVVTKLRKTVRKDRKIFCEFYRLKVSSK